MEKRVFTPNLLILTSGLVLSTFSLSFTSKLKNNESNNLLYKLDFKDSNNIFKNSSSNEYLDASYVGDNDYEVNEGKKDSKGISFKSKKNAINLPIELLKDKESLTISSWVYLPKDATTNLLEFYISNGSNLTFYTIANKEDKKGSYEIKLNESTIDSKFTPVIDSYYLMSYVFDTTNDKLIIYQNANEVASLALDKNFKVDDFYNENATFSIGSDLQDNDNNDFIGRFSDIRIYDDILNEDSIRNEYNLSILDFKTAEYTFNDSKNILKDNIRGNDLKVYKGDINSLSLEEGGVRLNNGIGLTLYDREDDSIHNKDFFKGHSYFTVSFNLIAKNKQSWKRLFEFQASRTEKGDAKSLRVANMIAGGGNKGVESAYAESGLGDAFLTVDTETPFVNNNELINLTYCYNGTKYEIYENGIKKYSVNLKDRGANLDSFTSFLYEAGVSNGASLVFGHNKFEEGNWLDGILDNIRIYAAPIYTQKDGIYAKEGIIGTDFSLNANFGENPSTKKEYLEVGSRYILPGNDIFIRPGFRIKNWNTKKDGKGTSYNIGDEVIITENLTLYAIWESTSAVISFDANGGRGNMTNQVVNFQEDATLKENEFVRTGYNFKKWNTKVDGSGDSYFDKGIINLEKSTTLYAIWEAKNFKIHFDANGGKGIMSSLDMTYDKAKILSKNIFRKEHYSFNGWALTKEGIAIYEDEASVTSIGIGEDITLYATWIVNKYKIIFDVNGGTGSQDPIIVDANTLFNIPNVDFKKGDLELIGFSTTKDGEVKYKIGDKLPVETDITLYAIYGKKDVNPIDPTTHNDKLNGGEIAIIVIASILGVGIIGGLTYFFIKKKKGNKK